MPNDLSKRSHSRQRVPATAMVLAPVHEVRVSAERHVVQESPMAEPSDIDPPLDPVRERSESRFGIVACEAEVAREVVARPERDADERQISLDRDRGDGGERAVTARHAQGFCVSCTSELLLVVTVP
jgi:hypothetical protein